MLCWDFVNLLHCDWLVFSVPPEGYTFAFFFYYYFVFDFFFFLLFSFHFQRGIYLDLSMTRQKNALRPYMLALGTGSTQTCSSSVHSGFSPQHRRWLNASPLKVTCQRDSMFNYTSKQLQLVAQWRLWQHLCDGEVYLALSRWFL